MLTVQADSNALYALYLHTRSQADRLSAYAVEAARGSGYQIGTGSTSTTVEIRIHECDIDALRAAGVIVEAP